MRIPFFIGLFGVPCILAVSLILAADAEDMTTAHASPVVAELFTSQGCSSCPPAERLFSELADQDNLITIEWHVDYWDDLVHGGSRWEDPYSSAANTSRQRDYNRALRGSGAVYTPQAIINGQSELVGSHSKDVRKTISNAPALPLSVSIENGVASIAGEAPDARITYVRLLKKHQTHIKGGENKGRRLAGKHIALSTISLGKWTGAPLSLELPSLEAGETCVILVQSQDKRAQTVGHILGAVQCDA